MRSRIKQLRGFLLALGLALGAVFPLPGQAAGFLPHRAVYDLDLKWTGSDSSISQAGGLYEFEWAEACDGWTVMQRSRIDVIYSTGDQIDFGWTMNSWESRDGTRYRFFIRKLQSGASVEEIRGDARLSKDGKGGVVNFVLPDARQVPLPPGTVFPTLHSLELMSALEDGSLPLWRIVFDGTGDEGIYGVSAVLARSFEPEQVATLASPLTAGRRAWQVELAFFELGDNQELPEQEQTVRLLEDGITDEIELDYGDFALDGRLVEIEALPISDCSN